MFVKFVQSRYPDLRKIMDDDENTLLLFPGEKAIDLNDYVNSLSAPNNTNFHIVLLDGTWLLAKGLYFKNTYLHKLKQVNIVSKHFGLMCFIVRFVPPDYCGAM